MKNKVKLLVLIGLFLYSVNGYCAVANDVRISDNQSDVLWINTDGSINTYVSGGSVVVTGTVTKAGSSADPVYVASIPTTTSGWTRTLVNGLTSPVTIKASSGSFGGYYCYNANSSVAYLQVFDTSGAVSLGSTAPVFSPGIPATSGANLEISRGLLFSNAIKVAATTTVSGATAVTTPMDCNIFYK